MVTFIGPNDRGTLEGVLEILERRLRSARSSQAGARLVRESARYAGAITELEDIRREILESVDNGPTPTRAQLAALRITIPEETRARLLGELEVEERGGAEAIADHLAHDERWDGDGWIDRDGLAVPTVIEHPACDRTCLSCQGGDHPACGMGCHDEEEGLYARDAREGEDPEADQRARIRAQDALATEIGYDMLGIPKGDPRRRGEER